MHLVSTSPGAERKASPVGECRCGIHQLVDRERHVLAGERRAIGELHVAPQLEVDAPAVFRDFPFGRQLAFQLLRIAIQADQHAAGQVANRLRRFVFHQQRVERFRIAAQAEAQLVRPLARRAPAREAIRARIFNMESGPPSEAVVAGRLTTTTSNSTGASIHGFCKTAV